MAPRCRQARKDGESIFFGDATNEDALRSAGVDRAKAVVGVLSDPVRRGARADRDPHHQRVGPHHPAHALQVGSRDGHAPGRDRRRGRGDGGVARGRRADDRAARRARQRDRRAARQLPARVDGDAHRARPRSAAREPAERHQQDADCDACAQRRGLGGRTDAGGSESAGGYRARWSSRFSRADATRPRRQPT